MNALAGGNQKTIIYNSKEAKKGGNGTLFDHNYPSLATKRKEQMCCERYFSFGFTFIRHINSPQSEGVICREKLTNMVPQAKEELENQMSFLKETLPISKEHWI